MENKEQKKVRLLSIDVMRGLTLFLMLFVNDLFTPGVPKWLVHTAADFDGMGLADWVFPGFLFMVGISIPYAIAARKKHGDSDWKIFLHVVIRTLSLLLIGVLILNSGRVNPELTGMHRLVWSGALYVCIFLLWNLYKRPTVLTYSLQGIGFLGLCYLVYVFRAGTVTAPEWLEIGWWGILGLIGWGYFTAAVVYLLANGKLWGIVLAWMFFLGLNMVAQSGGLSIWSPIQRIFGVVLSGNVPSIVLAGLTIGTLVKQYASQPMLLIRWVIVLGILSLVSGLVLRQWFIISKIYGTPSWAMLCNGISILVFALVYYVVDVRQRVKGIWVWQEAGKNSLTTYLAPDMIYFICWGFSLPIFFYKQADHAWLAILGSLVWAYAMLWFAILLRKLSIQLKL